MMGYGPGLARPLSFALIDRHRSYWAGHFYSVLQCLRYHNGLEYPGRKLVEFGAEDWSLAQLRGSAPSDFFGRIYQQMTNWGFQYLLVSLLNSRLAIPVVEALIAELERLWNVTFDKAFNSYNFCISGKDSDLSAGLDLMFAEVFPADYSLTYFEKQAVINNSDICLILNKPGSLEKKGVFGEIEGLKGYRIRRNSFWAAKSDYCVYAFGVSREQGSAVDYQVRNLDGINRVLITFQTEHFVVQDFQSTLWWFQWLFQNGPLIKPLIADAEIGYFYNILQMNWNKPVSNVLSLIEQHMGGDDIIAAVPGVSPIVPNLLSK